MEKLYARNENPKVTFRVRVGDEEQQTAAIAIGGEWKNMTTDDYFKGKRVVLFSLRCIYACSSQQLNLLKKSMVS